AYARWRSSDPGELLEPVATGEGDARRLLAPVMQGLAPGESRELDDATAAELLACYGIDVVPARAVTDASQAAAAAQEVGWPVALKARDEVLRHRADLGGVKLDLHTPEQLRYAMETMREEIAAVGRTIAGFEVQAMVPPGVACVVTGAEDDLYGPVLAFGLGGDAVELLGDLAYRIPPLYHQDVAGMIRSVKAAPRLFGHRGLPVLDSQALEDVVARLAQLTDDLAEISRVTLNPVLVARRGARVLSATIEVAVPWRTDTSRRTLSANRAIGAKMVAWPIQR
ncbi:MAG TPA: acetate--CoA ligase family protein, partial [Actinomycetaceae bacterium]|nr:acetate--CoA ligase family protein [Actinomycetaceae bacterium]